MDFKGEKRSNDTHASTTDLDARLYKKSEGDKSRLGYLSHSLMDNRNGLIVDAETTLATGTSESEAALTMAERTITKPGATLGADKAYDVAGFVEKLRKLRITPHVAQKKSSAIDARGARHAGYQVSLKKRKLVEEIFWMEQDRWRTAQGAIYRVGQGQGANDLHLLRVLTRMATIFGWRMSAI